LYSRGRGVERGKANVGIRGVVLRETGGAGERASDTEPAGSPLWSQQQKERAMMLEAVTKRRLAFQSAYARLCGCGRDGDATATPADNYANASGTIVSNH
jgi:hypothetical protein